MKLSPWWRIFVRHAVCTVVFFVAVVAGTVWLLTPEPAPQAWLPISDGSCPDTHPLKANPNSMIWHEPGGLSYVGLQNRAVLCFASPAEAEQAGYRRAER